MEVLQKPCRVSKGLSESQRMASRASAGGRGSVAKVQLGSAAAPHLPYADAVAAAAAAAAVPAFAATVSAAADPALPLGVSIVPRRRVRRPGNLGALETGGGRQS